MRTRGTVPSEKLLRRLDAALPEADETGLASGIRRLIIPRPAQQELDFYRLLYGVKMVGIFRKFQEGDSPRVVQQKELVAQVDCR